MTAKKSSTVPPYRCHKATGQGYVNLDGRRIYLGKHDKSESRQKYHQLVAEWEANGRRLPIDGSQITVVELISSFWQHAKQHYRDPDGLPTREQKNFRPVLRLWKKFYGHTLVKDFTPLALKTLRDQMIFKGWSRKFINRQVVRIRSVFKWGITQGIVPPDVHAALCALAGLQAGRSNARETDPIEPVSEEEVAAVLPHVAPTVADMINVQLLTGMRPDEVCRMRPVDLDTSRDNVWTYTPKQHKTRHRGKSRLIHVGPKAQAIIRPYLAGRRVDAYLFSPAEAEEKRLAALHAGDFFRFFFGAPG